MSGFEDISKMDLYHLDGDEPDPEERETAEEAVNPDGDSQDDSVETAGADREPEEEAGTGLDLAAGTGQETGTDQADWEAAGADSGQMPDPVGEHYIFDAKVTQKEMRAFLFAHNYRSPIMLVAILVGVCWPVYAVFMANGSPWMALLCSFVVLVLMPFSIYYRGKATVTQNPIYQKDFHYMLDEAGIHLRIEDNQMDVPWNQVYKTLFLRTSAVIYTGKINAYLIPTEAMGSQKDEIIQFIRKNTRK